MQPNSTVVIPGGNDDGTTDDVDAVDVRDGVGLDDWGRFCLGFLARLCGRAWTATATTMSDRLCALAYSD
jgi:hypothetical protein